MTKLEVGMYIRTREGIRIITDVWEDMYELNRDIHNRYPEGHCLFKEDIDEVVIGEPSFNVIDLIEEGDYVNGIYIEKNNGKYLETLETDYEDSSLGHIRYIRIYNDDIREVLTHEQYDATAYKLGGRV